MKKHSMRVTGQQKDQKCSKAKINLVFFCTKSMQSSRDTVFWF